MKWKTFWRIVAVLAVFYFFTDPVGFFDTLGAAWRGFLALLEATAESLRAGRGAA